LAANIRIPKFEFNFNSNLLCKQFHSLEIMAKMYEGAAIGIDLGTTYSCVGVWQEQNNRVEIIHNDQGNRITPSCVAFTDSQRLIGEPAKNQAASNPTYTVFGN
jgi:L1 cell adhesion molecule like protein